MSLPRLVVVDGPDVGTEFTIGPTGGGIGRGEGNVVQLSDLAVSRNHCSLRVEGDDVILVDAGSRNRTLVNGKTITEHRLVEGDEVTVGKTRLAYLPPEGGVAVVPSGSLSRVTMEVATDELLRAREKLASRPTGALAAIESPSDRARRHLAALARLGDGLRKKISDRTSLMKLVCEVAREALDADRAMLLIPDSSGRLAAAATAAAPGETAAAQVTLPNEVVDKAQRRGHAVVFTPEPAGLKKIALVALAAPVSIVEGGSQQNGILYADRVASTPAPPWAEPDLQLAACMSHLTSAALEGLAARDALQLENRALEERLGGGREFIGTSPTTRELLGFVGKVAPTDSTVLLLGESGSGKEMIASAIHYGSRRSKGPFICLSCATLSDTLLESELFGHEKGAFTGATDKKIGRFELAHGGTLFFDEVGELTPKCQTKLLRVLEERKFERVGGNRSIQADVRVITATNRSLSDMVARGEFREDLYYRLSVIQHEVPPLRARRDDIPALADHFLARVRFQTGRKVTGFSAEAMRALLAHPWPGNCRELKNAVERAVVLGEGELVRLSDLPPQVVQAAPGPPPTAPSAFAPMPPLPPRLGGATPTLPPVGASSLRDLEKQGIMAALAATEGNKAKAAAILEIDRSTLYKKLKEYGIET